MQTTLGHMISMIEVPFQRKASIPANRTYLLGQANRIRQIFYNLYREYEIEVDVTECFELQRFGTCTSCPEGYYGVTLPAHMNTVEAAWSNGVPIDLYTKWRETKVGLKPAQDCLLACYDVPGRFPTERDIIASGGTYIALQATDRADNGKSVEISYVAAGDTLEREAIQINSTQTITTTKPAIQIRSVVLPTLSGTVKVLESCSGRVLSEYMPFEKVPSYRRVKITGNCPCGQVLITANRQFQPVYWDTDIVETNNEDAIVNAALHLFYAGSGPQGIQSAEYHKALMKDSLKGEASRDTGVNRENDSGRFGPPVRGSRLWRGAGGHNITFVRN